MFEFLFFFLEMKGDLLVALKNQHDSRRYGLLLPIREWLPGLNEENLLCLLGKYFGFYSKLKSIKYQILYLFRYNESRKINSLCC